MTAPDGSRGWPLRRLFTEVVGSGPKSAEDMTRAQAREAMARLLAGDADPAQRTQDLIDLANDRGGPDNITVIFLQVAEARAQETKEVRSTPEARLQETKKIRSTPD